MRTAAFRRAQLARRKRWVRFLIRNIWGPWSAELADSPRFVGHMARTRKPCSCMGCGHRRLWEGPTMAERRAAITTREESIWDKFISGTTAPD